jgi:acetyl-CoA acetyltransferase
VRGDIPSDRMNVAGGSIALGHPFAATGGRLLLATCQALRQRKLSRGAISICAAGGGAGAALVSMP